MPVAAGHNSKRAVDPSNAQAVEELNRRLASQYAEMAQLAGGLAHEIKNPLSTIRLNLELLAEELDGAAGPKERRALGKVKLLERECQRLQVLLDDFLNYAKVRAVRMEPGSLNDVIEDVLGFFAPQAAESNIDIIRYLDHDLPSVMLDREAFRGALLNLVLNAQQAMPGGGQLVVRTRSTGPTVALDLIDTGCGMDDKTAAQIFQPFFSTKPSGSGLGLPTTAKLIDAHGGTITVLSEVGRGTQFTIELPVPSRLPAVDGGTS